DGLQPILCVGETQEERNQGQTELVLKRQIREGLAGVDVKIASHLIVAYEPVWAIGSLQAATPEMACDTHHNTRSILRELFGEEAEKIPILYGGSVNSDNAQKLVRQLNIDGFLVGSASLSAESFAKIVQMSENNSFTSTPVNN